MSECNYSDHSVSVVIVVVVNFCTISTSPKPLHEFVPNFMWTFLELALPSWLKSDSYPYLLWSYW